MYEIGDYDTVGYCGSCEHEELEGWQQPCRVCVNLRPMGNQWRQAEPKEEVAADA
jgi:hypothetical protein